MNAYEMVFFFFKYTLVLITIIGKGSFGGYETTKFFNGEKEKMYYVRVYFL